MIARIILLIGCSSLATNTVAEVVYQWRLADFEFPNNETRTEFLNSREFIPEHNMPLGMEVWRNKVFITVPRWRTGVVSTLNYITIGDPAESPLLKPYPSWEANRMHSPDGLVSIFRVRADACNRLWGLDTGVDDVAGNETVVKPNTLIAIDLETDEIILRYQLKPSDLEADSFFANLVVDSDPKACNETYVYMADFQANGLVVYDLAKNNSWRFSHHFFHFNPLDGNYNVSGFNFQWTDGLFGMALSNRNPDGYKTLFFHPMSSTQEFSVSTKVLRNETRAHNPDYYDFHYLGYKGPETNGPVVLLDLTTDIAYFPLVKQNAIACWDTHRPMNPEYFRIIWQDVMSLEYVNDIVLHNHKICAMADRLPILLNGKYNPKEMNFFISCITLADVLDTCIGDRICDEFSQLDDPELCDPEISRFVPPAV